MAKAMKQAESAAPAAAPQEKSAGGLRLELHGELPEYTGYPNPTVQIHVRLDGPPAALFKRLKAGLKSQTAVPGPKAPGRFVLTDADVVRWMFDQVVPVLQTNSPAN